MEQMGPGLFTCWAKRGQHDIGEEATVFSGSHFYAATVLEIADDGKFPDLDRIVFGIDAELPS